MIISSQYQKIQDLSSIRIPKWIRIRIKCSIKDSNYWDSLSSEGIYSGCRGHAEHQSQTQIPRYRDFFYFCKNLILYEEYDITPLIFMIVSFWPLKIYSAPMCTYDDVHFEVPKKDPDSKWTSGTSEVISPFVLHIVCPHHKISLQNVIVIIWKKKQNTQVAQYLVLHHATPSKKTIKVHSKP